LKIKVIATHYVEAPTWVEAEQQVEQQLVQPDEIESEPTSHAPKDVVMFGVASKLYNEHNKIYFDSEPEEYEERVESLKISMMNWLENIVDDIIISNEDEWGV
tara:strand:+ start:24307 stop:24615 length:309 start_codon:yes stop_codon:yes gene_type:complete